MAFTTFPSAAFAAVPTANDDTTKGYVVGSQWTDTSASPRRIYLCTDASIGAAVWVNAGGVTAHTALTALGWSASGHTGTVTSVATFDAGGAAQAVAATQDGTVLSRVGGVLAWATLAATVSFITTTETTEYLNFGATIMPEATAVVQAGVIA